MLSITILSKFKRTFFFCSPFMIMPLTIGKEDFLDTFPHINASPRCCCTADCLYIYSQHIWRGPELALGCRQSSMVFLSGFFKSKTKWRTIDLCHQSKHARTLTENTIKLSGTLLSLRMGRWLICFSDTLCNNTNFFFKWAGWVNNGYVQKKNV